MTIIIVNIIIIIIILIIVIMILKVLFFSFQVLSSVHELTAAGSPLEYLMVESSSIWEVPTRTIFCHSGILKLPGILLMYFSVPFLIRPRAPMITRLVVVFILHYHYYYFLKYYLENNTLPLAGQ